MLKSRTLNVTFWRFFEMMFWQLETPEKFLKSRTLTGAFYHYLKQCFGSCNCWVNVKIKDAKCNILTLFWNDVLAVGNSWVNVKIEDAKRNILTLFEMLFRKLILNDSNWSVLILFKMMAFFKSWNWWELFWK